MYKKGYEIINRFKGDTYDISICKTKEGYGVLGAGSGMRYFGGENRAMDWVDGWIEAIRDGNNFSFLPSQRHLGEALKRIMPSHGTIRDSFVKVVRFYIKNRKLTQ